jgi:hypothetical protein
MMNVCWYVGLLRLRIRNRYFIPESKPEVTANNFSFWKIN